MAKKANLAEAVLAGDEKLVERLLAKSPQDVHIQDGMGLTPLRWAVDQGREDIARLLLDAGASPDAQGLDGITPLHFASIKGELACARLMIPLANLDLIDFKQERTALGHALTAAAMASAGFNPGGGPASEAIANLLISEPARRAAVEQARELDAATPRGSPASKARV